jgi:hypothetical protein
MGSNINVEPKEVGYEGMDRIHMAEGRVQWWVIVNIVINLWVPQKARHFITS